MANIEDSISGVVAAGLPTTTRLRRTGSPSCNAISSKDGMLTRMNLPFAGTSILMPWLRSMLTYELGVDSEDPGWPTEIGGVGSGAAHAARAQTTASKLKMPWPGRALAPIGSHCSRLFAKDRKIGRAHV